jgi:hypothetical protein
LRTFRNGRCAARRWVAEPTLNFVAGVGGLARGAFPKSLRHFARADAAVHEIRRCQFAPSHGDAPNSPKPTIPALIDLSP